MNIFTRSICTAAVALAIASPAAAATTLTVSGRLLALSGYSPNVYDLSNPVSATFVYDEDDPDGTGELDGEFYYLVGGALTSFSIAVGDQVWDDDTSEGEGIAITVRANGTLKALDAILINENEQILIAGIAGSLFFSEFFEVNIPLGPLDFLVGDRDSFFLFLAGDDEGCRECSRVSTFSIPTIRQQFPGMAAGTFGSVVPEPASWALMIAGFGLVGSALRRRRAAFA